MVRYFTDYSVIGIGVTINEMNDSEATNDDMIDGL
jgi:hypothetical protein